MASPFSKFETFAGMVRHNGIDMKPTLLRVLTDFYVQMPAHTEQEEKHFVELALRLIEEVSAEARADTAQRLEAYGSAPAAVMARLMRTDVEPAATVAPESVTIEESPAIDPPAEAAAPAEPAEEISPPQPAHPTVSESDRAAAARFSDMFFAASSEERQDILRQLESGTAMPPALAREDAEAVVSRLEAAALKGRPFEFVREIEGALGVPRIYSEKIVTDTSGEPMLVLAKALAMPIDVVQRILLLVNPAIGTSVRRVFDLSDLYENLSSQSALRLMALWRHADMPHAPVHRPVQAPSTEDRDPSSQRQPAAAGKRDQRAS